MRRNGNRTIEVKKEDLIKKIKENKEKHLIAYDKAVIAYKNAALKQLSELTQKVNEGSLTIRLELVTPINNSTNYDKIINMFEWDVKEVVELDQNEFNEYVLDDTETTRQAMFSNTRYLG
jgi:NADH dehydrogenase/NADH:ubiquinone oxidoreductase subunit G